MSTRSSVAPVLGALAVGALLQGCSSVLALNPAMELAKAGSAVALTAIATGPSKARNSVYHEHPVVDAVCIDYDPTTPMPDVVPALQQEFMAHEISSRVYAGEHMPSGCRFRVSYSAQIEWGIPAMSDGYKPYLREATLTLRDDAGLVLASSAYKLDDTLQMGKWAPTRTKFAPMVTALVTGFDH